MKAAPPIEAMEILEENVLEITFEGMAPRYVDLNDFPLLGSKAQRLAKDPEFLASFKLVDGIPEWDGQCLLGPEDLLEHSQKKTFKSAGHIIAVLKSLV